MKPRWLVISLLVFGGSLLLAADPTADKSSEIFQNLIHRFPRREPESHALLEVKLRSQPGIPQNLWATFTIEQSSSNSVLITLTTPQKGRDVVWEAYELKIDDAIRI